ncbi:MAG TPA: bifunctional phosphoribosylaminoimidazolecarboxamide formyltransferase/IMP cyclohydrolase [Candidatus Dormibacteraeota bacterium]
MPRALLSVSNKAGLAGFARGLRRLGFELYSTGGTLRVLEESAVDARSISDLTGFPEILDGRVKTLHPAVHAGLLARRDNAEHMRTLEQHGLQTIELVCVSLYPFEETAGRPGSAFDEVLEQIDIGGPTLLRAAAKNHESVVVVVRPERYTEILQALSEGGVSLALRRRLAAEAYAHTAAYDSQIAAWLRQQEGDGLFPAEISFPGYLAQPLRYGENPHQKGAFYRSAREGGGLGGLRQLQGADLSFNNLQDAAAALGLAQEFEKPAVAIIKHTNPCGLAVGEDLAEAYQKAFECDTQSAYGGVVALNRPLDAATAELMGPIFLEVVAAPAVLPEAAEILSAKTRLRLLEVPGAGRGFLDLDIRSVPGGLLVQTWDRAGFDRDSYSVATSAEPTPEQWEELRIAWLTAKHVKSNAIVLVAGGAAVGVGAGQMSRVDAVRLAVERAGDRAGGTVLASDAFFPFPDGVEAAIKAGVTAIIQPGGSMRDQEVIAVADAVGVPMVMTGMRHFKH